MNKKDVKKAKNEQPVTRDASAHASDPQEKNKKDKKAIIGFLVVVGILILGIWVSEIATKPQGIDKVVATVNGQEITMKDLQEIYWTIPPQVQNDPSIQEIVLNQSIYETILLQEATRQGITVMDEEIERVFTNVRMGNNVTLEDLQSELQKAGLDMTFVKKFYRKQILITKLLQQEAAKVTINEQDVTDILKQFQQDENDTLLREQAKAFILQQEMQTYAQNLLAKAEIKK